MELRKFIHSFFGGLYFIALSYIFFGKVNLRVLYGFIVNLTVCGEITATPSLKMSSSRFRKKEIGRENMRGSVSLEKVDGF